MLGEIELDKKLKGLLALKAIADHIPNIPDEQWHMGTWKKSADCGTIGCAIGHSINLPEVKATGLGLAEDRNHNLVPVVQGNLIFDGYYGSIGKAFGISRSTADRIFGFSMISMSENSKEAVRQRILEEINFQLCQTPSQDEIN